MNEFNKQLLRLKRATDISEDQGIAALLGLTKSAFSERKKRDSFPTKEVYALAAQRPELGLDPSWIVTGSSIMMETEDRGEAHLLQCYRLMNTHDRANMNKIAAVLSDAANLSSDEIDRRLSNYKGSQ